MLFRSNRLRKCGDEDVEWGELPSYLFEEALNGGSTGSFIRPLCESKVCGNIREAYVIELNFIEARLCSFARNRNIVGSHLRLKGIGPCETLAFAVDMSIVSVDGQIGTSRGQRGVFEDDDTRDCINAVLVQTTHQGREARDRGDLSCIVGLCERHL